MKTFAEYLNEARVEGKPYNGMSKIDRNLFEVNRGRKAGETSLDISGNEIPKSVIVSNGMAAITIAYKDGPDVRLEIYNSTGVTASIVMSNAELNLLKKL